jgi:hypothetical protein
MGRSSYSQSVSTSTRTFQTPSTAIEVPVPKKAKRQRDPIKLPKLPNVALPTSRLPWMIVAALVLFSAFMFVQYRGAQAKLRSPQATAANVKQVNDTLGKVARLVIVPSGETPTVATVSNADKLKAQTFFANAKDGDKVIVYAKAKQAILYRPSTNQIVTMAPVSGAAQ